MILIRSAMAAKAKPKQALTSTDVATLKAHTLVSNARRTNLSTPLQFVRFGRKCERQMSLSLGWASFAWLPRQLHVMLLFSAKFNS